MDYCEPTEQEYDRLSIVIAVAAGLHARPQDVGERMAAAMAIRGTDEQQAPVSASQTAITTLRT